MATVTIIVRPTIPGTLSNVATVAGQQPDPNPDNNTTLPVLTPVSPALVGPTADLTVTKTGLSASIVGQSLTYTITASNLGPNADPSVVLEDVLPAGVTFVSSSIPPTTQTAGSLSFNLGSLAVGALVTVTLVCRPECAWHHRQSIHCRGLNPRPQSLEQFGNGADCGRPSPAHHGCETSAFRLPSPSHTPGPHFQCSTGASNGTSRGQLSNSYGSAIITPSVHTASPRLLTTRGLRRSPCGSTSCFTFSLAIASRSTVRRQVESPTTWDA